MSSRQARMTLLLLASALALLAQQAAADTCIVDGLALAECPVFCCGDTSQDFRCCGNPFLVSEDTAKSRFLPAL